MTKRIKQGTDVNCSECGKLFYVSPARLRRNKNHTCSGVCSGKHMAKTYSEKVKVPCVICGIDIFYKLSHFKQVASPCCSYTCSSKMRSIRNKGDGNVKSLKLTDRERIFWNRTKSLKLRAEAKKIDFNIDYKFLENLFDKQEGLCYYTRLPMKLTGGQQVNQEIFSVDRVDSKKGYTKDNIVLCLNIINRFKGDTKMEFFQKICDSFKNNSPNIQIKKLCDLATIPKFQTSGSAGFDFHSIDELVLMPGDTKLISTGLSFSIPRGYELQVRPRSGISIKSKARVILGTVDSDYRGEVKIIIENTGHLPYTISIHDRIAQGIISKIEQFQFQEVSELEETERSGGFGSTGT